MESVIELRQNQHHWISNDEPATLIIAAATLAVRSKTVEPTLQSPRHTGEIVLRRNGQLRNMPKAVAGQDRDGIWHLISPGEKCCSMGHRLREWDDSGKLSTMESKGGATEVRRAAGNASYEYGGSVCRDCEW